MNNIYCRWMNGWLDEWKFISNVSLEKKKQMYISNNDFTVINPPSSFTHRNKCTPSAQQSEPGGSVTRVNVKMILLPFVVSSSENKNCLMPHEFEGRYWHWRWQATDCQLLGSTITGPSHPFHCCLSRSSDSAGIICFTGGDLRECNRTPASTSASRPG